MFESCISCEWKKKLNCSVKLYPEIIYTQVDEKLSLLIRLTSTKSMLKVKQILLKTNINLF